MLLLRDVVHKTTPISSLSQLRLQDYTTCKYGSTVEHSPGNSNTIDFDTEHPIMLDLPVSKVR